MNSWEVYLAAPKYDCVWLEMEIKIKTRIAERRFLTGLQRGYFFWGEGAAMHTQATIKPCR